ncbi:asparagine synthetase domain-containing protein 1-like isoform X2 [Ostrea edulis]|nr:asparagine synthetase domain-containing protein 1-like isoform X2 [Ostrea edulis]
MRGPLTPQPARNKRGCCLLWNGEIFGGLQVSEEENDTALLLEKLSEKSDAEHILSTLSKLHGPWACIYWQEEKKTLWFGRDFFGRRSMCWHLPRTSEDSFILTSVRQNTEELREVPSIGLYSVTWTQTDCLNVTVYSWTDAVWPGTMNLVTSDNLQSGLAGDIDCNVKFNLHSQYHLTRNIPPLNKSIPDLELSKIMINDPESVIRNLLEDASFCSCVHHLIHLLLQSVTVRVFNQILLSQNEHKYDSDLKATSNLSHHQPDDENPLRDSVKPEIHKCLSDGLSDVRLRHPEGGVMRGCAKIAVLFSGGVDSAVLAALVDKCLPSQESVDLINVAFERTPPQKQRKPSEEEKWNVPDRQTGFQALQELNPDRKWNFVMVNVSIAELQKQRSEHIRHLLYPLETVLDDSIGCAVWFAARGEGILGNGEHAGIEYKSSAKVVLCGMGADEQFAGYSRHRGKFEESGWQGLVDEINMEIQRISARNLGRDDRVITDHGKEARFPFLDENVVSYLQTLPVQVKANLCYPRGLGEKILLRACAVKLGLTKSALFPKRAIQFGSRIAKTENNKEKASEKCARLADPT